MHTSFCKLPEQTELVQELDKHSEGSAQVSPGSLSILELNYFVITYLAYLLSQSSVVSLFPSNLQLAKVILLTESTSQN